MGTIKTIPNPEAIKDKKELDDIIAQLEDFERVHGKSAGVVKRQNISLGSSYDIVTAEEAEPQLGKWVGSELYLKFWPKSVLYGLQKKY